MVGRIVKGPLLSKVNIRRIYIIYMALVDQDKKAKIELVNGYIQGKIQDVNLKLHREEDSEDIFDDTFKATLDTSAKQDEADIIKMLRWLADNLGFTAPAAFTDGEVDTINPRIRQKEDGL